MISCRARLVTIAETWLYHYDPETKQQSMEWRNSGSPRPKKIPSAKIRWKCSRLNFLWSRRHPPHWLSSKGPNYQRGILFISAIEGYFEGQTPRENHQVGSCSWTKMLRLTGHLQRKRNWPTWAFSVLITHPILRIWLGRTTTCSLECKNNWKVTIFRPKRRSLLARIPGWMDNYLIFFFEWLVNLEQRTKKCSELRGEYVE